MAKSQIETTSSDEDGKKLLPLLINRIIAGGISVVVTVVVIICLFMMFEDVAKEDVVVIQAPFTGELHAYTTPGTVFQNFGTVTTYKRRSVYEFECTETKVERTRMERVSEKVVERAGPDKPPIEKVVEKDVPIKYQASVWTGGLDIRFNDGGHGTVCGSLQYEMPEDAAKLKELSKRFPGTEAVKALLKKQTDSAIYLAGQLMSSKESYNETRNDLIHAISDQIQNGVYRTKTKTVQQIDPLTQQQKWMSVGEIIKGTDGQPERQEPSALHEFGVRTFNFTISKLPYDEQVEAQIQQQQRLTMDVQTSVAELRKAEQRAQTVEQQGKANAAEAKWAQETIKAQKVTEAQQDKEVKETEAKRGLEVAKLDRQAAEETKQKDILLGEGESTRKRLVIEADGALADKLKAYVAVNERYATAIENYKGNWVPGFVMTGGSGASGVGATGVPGMGANGAQVMIDLLTAKAAKDLALDMSVQAMPPRRTAEDQPSLAVTGGRR
jgi:hypothetical protein